MLHTEIGQTDLVCESIPLSHRESALQKSTKQVEAAKVIPGTLKRLARSVHDFAGGWVAGTLNKQVSFILVGGTQIILLLEEVIGKEQDRCRTVVFVGGRRSGCSAGSGR